MLYDGINLLSHNTAQFLQGNGLDTPLKVTAGGVVSHYLTDSLGSVTQLTNATGAPIARYDYQTYGKQEAGVTPLAANPFTYTAREDDGTGLLYYRNRYYDPTLQAFISQDPLGDAQRYVGGNPLSFTDPLGLGPEGQAIGGTVGGIIGGAVGLTTGVVGGTVVAPGVGTVGGGIAGAGALAGVGAATGAIIGGGIQDYGPGALRDINDFISQFAGKDKGGNLRNEYYYAARNLQQQGQDPCEYLRLLEKSVPSSIEKAKIRMASKLLGCDSKDRQYGRGCGRQ
jgi:RHS repeat-associated protein